MRVVKGVQLTKCMNASASITVIEIDARLPEGKLPQYSDVPHLAGQKVGGNVDVRDVGAPQGARERRGSSWHGFTASHESVLNVRRERVMV